MVTRTPPQNYQRYFGAVNEQNVSEMKLHIDNYGNEKTDNNTARVNKEQADYNTRYIRPNHDAVFGFYPKDGYILPGRTLNAERNQGRIGNKQDNKENKTRDQPNETKYKTDKDIEGENNPEQYDSVRRGLNLAQERLKLVNNKVEALDSGWRHIPQRVGEVETSMASNGRLVEELEWRNKVHSAKIHELERELKQVQLENRAIKGRILGPGQQGYSPIPEQDGRYQAGYSPRYNEGPEHRDIKFGQMSEQERYVRGKDGVPSKMAKNDQYNSYHSGKIFDEKGNSYWGLNKIYDPDIMTAYRNEHVPYLMSKAEQERVTQYKQDFETEVERNRRKEEEYRMRQREMENRLMRAGEMFEDFKRPFDPFNPPKDINKYFHHYGHRKPERLHDDDGYGPQRSQVLLDTTYHKNYTDYEFKNPNLQGYANATAGGLCFIRFHGSCFADVNTALHLLQRSLSVCGGRVGIASSPNVILLQGSRGWRIAKREPRPQVPVDYKNVYDAILAIWFPTKAKASELFRGEHNNRFREPTFLLPYGYDSTFVSLREVPRDDLDTFLVIEVPDVKDHYPEHLQNFEIDGRTFFLNICPNSQPFFCAATCRRSEMEIDGIKPGNIFKEGSRVYISAFGQLSDVARVWNTGDMADLMDKYGIRGDIQAFAFSMKDMKDHFSTPHWR